MPKRLYDFPTFLRAPKENRRVIDIERRKVRIDRPTRLPIERARWIKPTLLQAAREFCEPRLAVGGKVARAFCRCSNSRTRKRCGGRNTQADGGNPPNGRQDAQGDRGGRAAPAEETFSALSGVRAPGMVSGRASRPGAQVLPAQPHHPFRFGHRVRPHTNGRARPSEISIAPTSLPPALSTPHRRPQLQRLVPSVPGRQAQRTRVRSRPPLAMIARSRWVACLPSRRSESHHALLVSGALNPTRRQM